MIILTNRCTIIITGIQKKRYEILKNTKGMRIEKSYSEKGISHRCIRRGEKKSFREVSIFIQTVRGGIVTLSVFFP